MKQEKSTQPSYVAEKDGKTTHIIQVNPDGSRRKLADLFEDDDMLVYNTIDFFKDREFYRALAEERKKAEPTPEERSSTRWKLFRPRSERLAYFLQQIPDSREVIGSAAMLVAESAYGTIERAIQAFQVSRTTRKEAEGMTQ